MSNPFGGGGGNNDMMTMMMMQQMQQQMMANQPKPAMAPQSPRGTPSQFKPQNAGASFVSAAAPPPGTGTTGGKTLLGA